MANKVKNSRLSLKIFALVMAIILWLILTYTVNPTITQSVNNVPVAFSGTDELAKRGLVLINTSNIEDIDIKIRGARSLVINALSSVRATIDVSDITAKGKINRYASYDSGVSGVYVEGRSSSLVTVEVDELVEKNLPVRVIQSSADKNRSQIVESVTQFDKLTVRGAKTELECIKEIVVELDVSEIKEDAQKECSYYFINTDGVKEELESLQNPPKKIMVTNNVFKRKTVPVKVELEGNSGSYHLDVKGLSLKETDIGIPDGYDGSVNELVVKFNPDDYEKDREDYQLKAYPPEGIFVRDNARLVDAKLELREVEADNQKG